MDIMDRIPWLEYNIKNIDFTSLPVPRAFATHLPYYLLPRDLRNKRGRVSDVIFAMYLNTMMKICLSDTCGRAVLTGAVEASL